MQLPQQVVARLGGMPCLRAVTRVQFRLPDADDFCVALSRSEGETRAASEPGEFVGADLVLELSRDTLDAIVEGRLSARHAFLLGEIQFSGDRELAAALADLFPATTTQTQ